MIEAINAPFNTDLVGINSKVDTNLVEQKKQEPKNKKVKVRKINPFREKRLSNILMAKRIYANTVASPISSPRRENKKRIEEIVVNVTSKKNRYLNYAGSAEKPPTPNTTSTTPLHKIPIPLLDPLKSLNNRLDQEFS